mmetsp:Transcript_13118/g.18571  ORF Transcript_13118/g.18571 Transcript_13118/m.18571 type:complete len:456 (+) Transcript_13118:133-1500(+)
MLKSAAKLQNRIIIGLSLPRTSRSLRCAAACHTFVDESYHVSSSTSFFLVKSINSSWSSRHTKFSTAALPTVEHEEGQDSNKSIVRRQLRNERWLKVYQRYKEVMSSDEEKSNLTPKEETKLRNWISNQKRMYHKRQEGIKVPLTDERIELLEQIGFDWNHLLREWEETFEQLEEFVRKNGHANVTQEDDQRLVTWVYKQRFSYKLYQDNKPTEINEERIKKLEELGFIWDMFQDSWESHYDELKRYFEKEGHTNLPDLTKSELGRWVHTQRRFEKLRQEGKASSMTDERKARLDELNFVWDAHEAQWQSRYKELCDYQKTFGDCLVPKSWAPNVELANWVDSQRYRHKKWKDGDADFYTVEREALLDKIGFAWNAHDAQWERRYAELEAFIEVNGVGSYPTPRADRSLNNWVRTQQKHHRNLMAGAKTSLTKERIDKLNKLGFRWESSRIKKKA